MKCRTICNVFLLLCLFLGLAGCKPEDFKLYYEIQTEITTVDPQLAASDSELLLIRNMFEGLYRLDGAGKPVAGAAECQVSADGRQYRFTLRKGAQWFDGTPLTSNDYAFGIERALTRATGSPCAQSLFCIQNAEAFYNGSVAFDQVGVHIASDREFTITLHTADADFPYILTTACAMPCNREFFNSTNGRYGLDKSSILSNGSFYLQFWDEENGLVLHKDEDYNGDFIAHAYAVSLSVAKDSDTAGRLLEKNIDGGRVPYNEASRLPAADFTLQKFPVTTYALVFNAGLDAELRNILMQAVDIASVQKSCTDAMLKTDALIPSTLPNNGGPITYPAYDPAKARERFLQYTAENQMPALRVLCLKDDNFSALCKQIITHWQNTLGAYSINIEYVDTETELLERLQAKDYAIALAPFQDTGGTVYDFLFPFSAESPQNYLNRKKGAFDTALADYAEKETDAALQNAIQALSKEDLLIPICSVNKIYALSSAYKNATFYISGGEIDFSLLTQ